MDVFYKSIFSSPCVRSIKKERAKETFEKLLMDNMDDKIPIVISRINTSLAHLKFTINELYFTNISYEMIMETTNQAIEEVPSGRMGLKDDEIISSGIKRISYMGFSMLLVLNAFMNVAHKKNDLHSDQSISSVIKNPEKEKNVHSDKKTIRIKNGCRLL